MNNQTKYLLQRSEDFYTTDTKLITLFPHCTNLYEYKKQPWITYQQIYEVNLEYRLKELRKYQTRKPRTTNKFQLNTSDFIHHRHHQNSSMDTIHPLINQKH
jgi:hypothetical protein